jgi:methyl-accepting chemotaxis protein
VNPTQFTLIANGEPQNRHTDAAADMLGLRHMTCRWMRSDPCREAEWHQSVLAIKEIGGTIGSIYDITSTIAVAVEEQGVATQNIARSVGFAAEGTTSVATNITDVNRSAMETGAASTKVLSSAQSLSEESHRLKVELERFLSTVRAA